MALIMSHERMNEAEMLFYFHSKLPDPARGTNSKHLGNGFVFVWAYKIKCTCFENNFCPSLLAKARKGELTLLTKLQPFFVDVTIIVLTCVSLGSPRWKVVCFLASFSFG